MPTSRHVLGAATLLAALALGGCTDDDATPLSPPTTSPAALPSATDSPTATPEEEAERVVREYFAALHAARRSGDTTDLRGISDRRCVDCQSAIESLELLYARGGSLSVEKTEIESLALRRAGSDRLVVEARVVEQEAERIDSPGEAPVVFAEQPENLRFVLAAPQGSWVVRQIVVMEQS